MLFEPYHLGGVRLSNRVVMAPMTRSRAAEGDLATRSMATYYAQRATAGLIVTEGTQISGEGKGYLDTPGIHSPQQVEAWSHVVRAVHQNSGVIFAQLWHVGRVSHPSTRPPGVPSVSSMPAQARNTYCYGSTPSGQPGRVEVDAPIALDTAGISRVLQDYVHAANAARQAGFDGVEIHAANGYLCEQFINAGFNKRTDRYGGASIDDRLRFTLEVVDAICGELGSNRVGIRISPFGRQADMHAFDGEEETWLALASRLASRHLAYVHLSDQQNAGISNISVDFLRRFRERYSETLIVAGGYTRDSAEAVLSNTLADLVAFGRPFIANPDLVFRLQKGLPLAGFDRDTLYGGGDQGFIDYPQWKHHKEDENNATA